MRRYNRISGGKGGRGVSQESRVSFGGDDLRGVVRGDEI